MTRKKWNKLRRQRPELFGWLPPFEKWNCLERRQMAKIGKAEAITRLTTWMLTDDYRYTRFGNLFMGHFNPLIHRPGKPGAPPQPPGKTLCQVFAEEEQANQIHP